ncbi:CDGSH iron-sulfur domain-containing protein [Streptomyces sp. NPDC051742]|uniref:CDGSH iron-sulfur domain-containing protein n=1 Tax=unclassified Streptomyces TaxID=2593676 RepID=UPI003446E838
MSASPRGNAPHARTRVAAPPEPRDAGRDAGASPEGAGSRTWPPRVQPLLEGPLLVEGPADIVMPDGSVLRCERPVMALCTCRRTLRAPFCDTSHRPRLRRAPGAPAPRRRGRAPDDTADEAGADDAAGEGTTDDGTTEEARAS